MAGGSGGLLVLKEIQLSLLKIIIVAKLFSFVLGKPIYYQRRASIDCCSKIAHPWPTANLILQCDNKWIKFGSFSFRPHLYLFFVPPGFFSSSFFPRRYSQRLFVITWKIGFISVRRTIFDILYSFLFLLFALFVHVHFTMCTTHARTFEFAVCCVLIVFVNDSYCVRVCLPMRCNANGTERVYWTTYLTYFLVQVVLMMLLVCNNSILMNNEHWCVRDMN